MQKINNNHLSNFQSQLPIESNVFRDGFGRDKENAPIEKTVWSERNKTAFRYLAFILLMIAVVLIGLLGFDVSVP